MKKRSLIVVILVILGVILSVILVDFAKNRPDRRGENPYALEVDKYKEADPELISHKETRVLDLGGMEAASIDYFEDHLVVVGKSSLLILTPQGERVDQLTIGENPVAVSMNEEDYFVAYRRHVSMINREVGSQVHWDELDERTVITNLALGKDRLYVADAGNRRVLIYSLDGQFMGEFEGKADSEAGHGFIVPSANFDLVVNAFGELWVVNPGKHALERYSDEGRLMGFWERRSFEIDGFLGCCNPARITSMEDGAFITSEKKMIRIKIHEPSGELRSVIALPGQFEEEGKAPDVCAGPGGVVYALDFERMQIRIFEEVKDE